MRKQALGPYKLIRTPREIVDMIIMSKPKWIWIKNKKVHVRALWNARVCDLVTLVQHERVYTTQRWDGEFRKCPQCRNWTLRNGKCSECRFYTER